MNQIVMGQTKSEGPLAHQMIEKVAILRKQLWRFLHLQGLHFSAKYDLISFTAM